MSRDGFRRKLMDAYARLTEDITYVNSNEPLEVFVRRGKNPRKEIYEAASILGLATAITPGGSMLYIGGQGSGKTTLAKSIAVMVGGVSEDAVEDIVLRMHPELTEEKIVARPDYARLMHSGEEQYRQRKFVLSNFKIGDEFNRSSPEVNDLFFSGIDEGVWKYADMAHVCPEQRFYGTLNPAGEGTFDLDPALLDRFVVSCEVTPPSLADLAEIGSRKDVRIHGRNIPRIMEPGELLEATRQADEIPLDYDAQLQMGYFQKELTLCIRADGSKSKTQLKPSEGLCKGCHYATEVRDSAAGMRNPCQMVDNFVGTRTHEVWARFAKRVAYLLGEDSVTVDIAGALAPYIFYHRVQPNGNVFNKGPYYGQKTKLVRDAWAMSKRKLDNREEAEKIFLRLIDGKGTAQERDKLRQMDDLIVKLDYFPYTEGMDSREFREYADRINSAGSGAELGTLMSGIRDLSALPLGAQNQLRALARSRESELKRK